MIADPTAAAIEQAVLAERDACATIADTLAIDAFGDGWVARKIAQRIRARTRPAAAIPLTKDTTNDQ